LYVVTATITAPTAIKIRLTLMPMKCSLLGVVSPV
jgi:hypothetical protein